MELPIFVVLLVACLAPINPHPRNSDIITKDYYKRQILQPIPGYIPVYIKTEGEPLVRREKVKHNPNVHPEKAVELDKTRDRNKEVLPEIEDKTRNESSLKESEKSEIPSKVELSKTKEKHEKIKSSRLSGGTGYKN